ncbi:MAG TPA: biopolymer transporter ExbD [Gemmatimonadota bacterium]|nr:biopolymer transporter ExbD [Gemmatimonadota bacterium]
MAILERKERVSDEIPTASMADIAFLLLIFFLTTTVFNEEKGLPIVLPEADQEEVDVSAKNLIFFLVQADGSVVVRRGESEQEQVVSANQIEDLLRAELAANENLIAAIKTAPSAAYRHMIEVLDEVKLAGAERISLQMLE